jgi:hypothetical protein
MATWHLPPTNTGTRRVAFLTPPWASHSMATRHLPATATGTRCVAFLTLTAISPSTLWLPDTRYLPPMAIGYLPVPPTATGNVTYRHQLPGYVSVVADRAALLLAHLGAHRHARVPRSLLVERTGRKQRNPSILSNGLLLFNAGLQIRIQSGLWIRIRNPESGSGSRRAKMTHKSKQKFVKVHVLKCWMASFES